MVLHGLPCHAECSCETGDADLLVTHHLKDRRPFQPVLPTRCSHTVNVASGCRGPSFTWSCWSIAQPCLSAGRSWALLQGALPVYARRIT